MGFVLPGNGDSGFFSYDGEWDTGVGGFFGQDVYLRQRPCQYPGCESGKCTFIGVPGFE